MNRHLQTLTTDSVRLECAGSAGAFGPVPARNPARPPSRAEPDSV